MPLVLVVSRILSDNLESGNGIRVTSFNPFSLMIQVKDGLKRGRWARIFKSYLLLSFESKLKFVWALKWNNVYFSGFLFNNFLFILMEEYRSTRWWTNEIITWKERKKTRKRYASQPLYIESSKSSKSRCRIPFDSYSKLRIFFQIFIVLAWLERTIPPEFLSLFLLFVFLF